jgi:hypothetical protein
MKHFGIARWVDFTRDMLPPEQRRQMNDHLASGCSDCRATLNFCDKLARVCRHVAKSVVPDEALRKARTIFPARPPERPKRPFRIPVALLYDSFLVPSPAGLRSTWQVGWQALFQAGDCSVDLRVEPELRTSRAAVIGQISNHVLPGTEMADIPVYLKAGKQVVAETRSNRFGEFQMEYEQQARLQLCIYLDEGSKYIQMPLKRLGSDKPSGSTRLSQAGGKKFRGDEPL